MTLRFSMGALLLVACSPADLAPSADADDGLKKGLRDPAPAGAALDAGSATAPDPASSPGGDASVDAPRAAVDHGGYRPHYQGYGVSTRGGRGGVVNRVTKLVDDGSPGTLRWALAARPGCANTPETCARIVVFETSGTITLSSWIIVNSPFVTIAGQTAPSPGITIRGAALALQTHDAVVQHVRIRPGDSGFAAQGATEGFGLMIGECDATTSPTGPCAPAGANNIVIDHVTVSWAVAANFEFSTTSLGHGTPYNYAVLDSMNAESLHDNPASSCDGYAPGTCPKYGFPTSLGVLVMVGARPGVTMARNLFASNDHRNPWISNGHHLSLYNNVFYNGGSMAYVDGVNDISAFMFYVTQNASGVNDCSTATNANPSHGVHVGNHWIHGPNTPAGMKTVKVWKLPPTSELLFSDNVGPGFSPTNPWGGVFFASSACGDDASTYRIASPPAWHSAFAYETLPSSEVESFVLAHAGARPRERTSTDARIASEVAARRGSIKNCVGPWPGTGPWGGDCLNGTAGQSSGNAGGWPSDEAVVHARALTLPADPNGVAPGQTFRTNIEAWLESFATALE